MNKHLIRLVALLLIPCLIADPATVSAYSIPSKVQSQWSSTLLQNRMGEDALELAYVAATRSVFKEDRAENAAIQHDLSWEQPIPTQSEVDSSEQPVAAAFVKPRFRLKILSSEDYLRVFENEVRRDGALDSTTQRLRPGKYLSLIHSIAGVIQNHPESVRIATVLSLEALSQQQHIDAYLMARVMRALEEIAKHRPDLILESTYQQAWELAQRNWPEARPEINWEIHESALQVVTAFVKKSQARHFTDKLASLPRYLAEPYAQGIAGELIAAILNHEHILYPFDHLSILEPLRSNLEDLLIRSASEHNAYNGITQALRAINKFDSPDTRSLSFRVQEVPEPRSAGHPWPHYWIYSNAHFIQQTSNVSPVKRYSIGLAVHRLLERYSHQSFTPSVHFKRPKDLHQSVVNRAVDFILSKRAAQGKKIVLGPGRQVINVFHQEMARDRQKLQDFEEEKWVASVQNFIGADRKQAILDAIGYSPTSLTLYFDGHGGPNHLWLNEGLPGNEISDKRHLKNAIGFVELADALERMSPVHDLSEVNLVLDSCFAADFATNLLNELARRNITALPSIFAASNYGAYAYYTRNKKNDSTFFRALEKIRGAEPVTFSHLYQIEDDMFASEDAEVFIPINPAELTAVFGPGRIRQPASREITQQQQPMGRMGRAGARATEDIFTPVEARDLTGWSIAAGSIFLKDYERSLIEPPSTGWGKLKARLGDPIHGAPYWEWIFQVPVVLMALSGFNIADISRMILLTALLFVWVHPDRPWKEQVQLFLLSFAMSIISLTPVISAFIGFHMVPAFPHILQSLFIYTGVVVGMIANIDLHRWVNRRGFRSLSAFLVPIGTLVALIIGLIAFLGASSGAISKVHGLPNPDTAAASQAAPAQKPLDEATVRNGLHQIFVRNKFFKTEIDEMALPPELGLTREEIHAAVLEMAALVATKPMTLAYGGDYLRVPFTVDGTGEHFTVSGNLFSELISDGDHILFHEAIHRTLSQKRAAKQNAAAQNRLSEGMRPYWSAKAKSAPNAKPMDVLMGGAWDQYALQKNPALAADAHVIVRNLWHGETAAHYAELALMNVWAKRSGMALKGYLEQKLELLAKARGYSYPAYMQHLSSNTEALGDPGLKWHTAWVMADLFDEYRVSPSLEDSILGQLMLIPARRWLVLGLARIDFAPNPQVDIYRTLDINLAFKQQFGDWAHRTIWFYQPPKAPILPKPQLKTTPKPKVSGRRSERPVGMPSASLVGTHKALALGVAPWLEELIRAVLYGLLWRNTDPTFHVLFIVLNLVFIGAHYFRNRAAFRIQFRLARRYDPSTLDTLLGTLSAPFLNTILSIVPLHYHIPALGYGLINALQHFGINLATFYDDTVTPASLISNKDKEKMDPAEFLERFSVAIRGLNHKSSDFDVKEDFTSIEGFMETIEGMLRREKNMPRKAIKDLRSYLRVIQGFHMPLYIQDASKAAQSGKLTPLEIDEVILPHMKSAIDGFKKVSVLLRIWKADLPRNEKRDSNFDLYYEIIDNHLLIAVGRLENRYHFVRHDRRGHIQSFATIVREVSKRSNFEGRGVTLDIEEGHPTVHGDRYALGSVYRNVVENALKATKDRFKNQDNPPSVKTTLSREGNWVVLRVIDQAGGIPPQFLEPSQQANRLRIFDPDASSKPGGGLGMTEIWYTIKDAGGTIDIQTMTGQGTTFTIKLPLYGVKEAGSAHTLIGMMKGRAPAKEVANVLKDLKHKKISNSAAKERVYRIVKYRPPFDEKEVVQPVFEAVLDALALGRMHWIPNDKAFALHIALHARDLKPLIKSIKDKFVADHAKVLDLEYVNAVLAGEKVFHKSKLWRDLLPGEAELLEVLVDKMIRKGIEHFHQDVKRLAPRTSEVNNFLKDILSRSAHQRDLFLNTMLLGSVAPHEDFNAKGLEHKSLVAMMQNKAKSLSRYMSRRSLRPTHSSLPRSA